MQHLISSGKVESDEVPAASGVGVEARAGDAGDAVGFHQALGEGHVAVASQLPGEIAYQALGSSARTSMVMPILPRSAAMASAMRRGSGSADVGAVE